MMHREGKNCTEKVRERTDKTRATVIREPVTVRQLPCNTLERDPNCPLALQSSVAKKFRTNIPVRFCSHTPSVPRASIIWLAPAVKVVLPTPVRLHLDRVHYAIGWHLGITLGVCMSGLEKWMAQACPK